MSRLVDVPPQRVYGNVPLLLPLIKMSEGEEMWLYGQPQIYDKNYPLDYSGLDLNPPWWANTGVGGGMNGVGDGNVALLPHEMGLGAIAKRVARKAPVVAKKSNLSLSIKKDPNPAEIACKKNGDLWSKNTCKTSPVHSKCTAGGGTWANNICTPNPAIVACASGGGKWSNGSCIPGTAQKNCQANGDVWANGACTLSAAHTTCTSAGDTWKNGACVPSAGRAACDAVGGTWANNSCTPPTCPTGQSWNQSQNKCVTPAGSTCPQVSILCPTGQVPNYGLAPGCVNTCVPDPNYTQPSAVDPAAQCQQSGGLWNGYSCGPQTPYASGTPYSGGGSGGSPYGGGGVPGPEPIPPGFENSGGAEQGQQSYPETPGQFQQGYGPPQQNYGLQQQNYGGGQAYNSEIMPQQSDNSRQSGATDTGTTDDTSEVASTNIFESIAKLFSGMSGTACGVNAPPPWFGVAGLGKGGNAPPLELVQTRFYEARGSEPVKQSTVVGVVGGSVALIAIGAAVYLWSKGKK